MAMLHIPTAHARALDAYQRAVAAVYQGDDTRCLQELHQALEWITPLSTPDLYHAIAIEFGDAYTRRAADDPYALTMAVQWYQRALH